MSRMTPADFLREMSELEPLAPVTEGLPDLRRGFHTPDPAPTPTNTHHLDWKRMPKKSCLKPSSMRGSFSCGDLLSIDNGSANGTERAHTPETIRVSASASSLSSLERDWPEDSRSSHTLCDMRPSASASNVRLSYDTDDEAANPFDDSSLAVFRQRMHDQRMQGTYPKRIECAFHYMSIARLTHGQHLSNAPHL